MRKDAARNRLRLIEAARARFRSGASDISLEEIADDAGVGRSTLFRHFKDRLDLIRAVQAIEMEAIATKAASLGESADALFPLMRMVAHLTALYRAMDDALFTSDVGRDMMAEVIEKTATVFAGPLLRAKQGELLDTGVDIDDVLIGCTMISGVVNPQTDDIEEAMDRALAILLRGLGRTA